MLNYELAKLELSRSLDCLQRARDAVTDDEAVQVSLASSMEFMADAVDHIGNRQAIIRAEQQRSLHAVEASHNAEFHRQMRDRT